MGFIKTERGSVTLEAAVVMPFFILFIVFLIFMIRFALIDIAINQAAGETAKNVATQVYPAKRLVDVAMDSLEPSGKYAEIISDAKGIRSKEHTSELQSRFDIVCRLLLE